jgi:hypothetical protein
MKGTKRLIRKTHLHRSPIGTRPTRWVSIAYFCYRTHIPRIMNSVLAYNYHSHVETSFHIVLKHITADRMT